VVSRAETSYNSSGEDDFFLRQARKQTTRCCAQQSVVLLHEELRRQQISDSSHVHASALARCGRKLHALKAVTAGELRVIGMTRTKSCVGK